MHVVAGLGNPGSRYHLTRHNVGFRVVDILAERGGVPGAALAEPRALDEPRLFLSRLLRLLASIRRGRGGGAATAGTGAAARGAAGDPEVSLVEATLAGERVLLVKPLAFMNASGPPIARVLARAGASPAELVVIVDDVALELGRVRVRARGRHGGHNGLRSLIAALGTEDFARVRVGVRGGELPADLADYVLAEVPRQETAAFEQGLVRAAEAVICLLREGGAAAMDRFNGRPV